MSPRSAVASVTVWPDAAAAAMRDHLDAVHDAVTTITRNTSE